MIPTEEDLAETAVTDSILRRRHASFKLDILVINLPLGVKLHDSITLDRFVFG